MIRQVIDATLTFTQGAASYTVQAVDSAEIIISEQELNGSTADINLHNPASVHTGNFLEGWTVDFKVRFSGEGALVTRWLGVVDNIINERPEYNRPTIRVKATDKGTRTLADAETTSNHPYVGIDAGAIIKDLIDTYAASISTTNINVSTGTLLTMTIPLGRNILSTIRELAQGTGYSFFVDETLAGYLVSRGGAGAYTLAATQASNITVSRDVTGLRNYITAYGAYYSDYSAMTFSKTPEDGWLDLDDGTGGKRRLARLTPTGSMIRATITARNNPSLLSTHNLLLRIQPGSDTAPVAVNNYTLDAAKLTVPNALVPQTSGGGSVGGDINALLADGQTYYWLIIESDGSAGNLLEVAYGVSGADNIPFHAIHQRKELSKIVSDATSIASYGTRKATLINRGMLAQADLDAWAAARLAEMKGVLRTVGCTLRSYIFNTSMPHIGDKVTVDLPGDGISSVDMGIIATAWTYSQNMGIWASLDLIVATSQQQTAEADHVAGLTRSVGELAEKVTSLEGNASSAITTSALPEHGADKHDSTVEDVANKNAASGYAGLDGSSKLTGTQQVYGSAANTACEGNDGRLPTSDEKAALAGTGTPSGANKYVTDDDSRLTGAGLPAHASSHKDAGSDEIEMASLATSEMGTGKRIAPNGAGGLAWVGHSVDDAATAEMDSAKVLKPDGAGGVAWGSGVTVAQVPYVFYPPSLVPQSTVAGYVGLETISSGESNIAGVMTQDCTVKKITLRIAVNEVTSGTIIFMVRKNFGDTALTLTLNYGVTGTLSASADVSFAAGDIFSIRYVGSTSSFPAQYIYASHLELLVRLPLS